MDQSPSTNSGNRSLLFSWIPYVPCVLVPPEPERDTRLCRDSGGHQARRSQNSSFILPPSSFSPLTSINCTNTLSTVEDT
jgi:hypothetical protein